MESVPWEDELDEMSERVESYGLSADVTDSESSRSDFSRRHVEYVNVNYTGTSAPVPIMLPAVGSGHVVYPVTNKMQKRDTDLSG